MANSDTTSVANRLTVGDLYSTHEMHDKWIDEWNFLRAAYQGIRSLIAYGALYKHERESEANYTRRVAEAYGFSYSKSIVNMFNFYLFKEPVKRQLGKLADDELWNMFVKNCDLENTTWDEFLLKQAKNSSVEGHVGILVDKPRITNGLSIRTRQQEIDNKIYPYVASYTPQAILDWKWERDEFGRPQLTYLKLYEKDDEYSYYRILTRESWELWREPDRDPTKSESQYLLEEAILVASGDNEINEIPFVILYSDESEDKHIGNSDICDIARIDASIMRNLSQAEEIINYSAFPMLVKPKPEKGEVVDDTVGATAVLEFDPEFPESKPSWLTSETEGPISAIFEVIGKKIEEIYRTSNIGGMAATEVQTEAKSGVALKVEFQLLNSVLVGKGKRVQRAEEDIIRFWLKYQNQEELMSDVTIERSDSYDIENLAQDLENTMTANTIVKSDTFKKKTMKMVARMMLPNENDDVYKVIDDEIDNYEFTEFASYPPKSGTDTTNQYDENGNVIPFPGKQE